jgi:hypothetical protein
MGCVASRLFRVNSADGGFFFFFQTKVLYVASLNDQVVPIYSGLFTAVSHPLILRALYIDGDAYQ